MQLLWAAGGTALPAAPLVAPAERSATETATGQGDAADLMIIIMMTDIMIMIMIIIMMIITALKSDPQVIWYNDSYLWFCPDAILKVGVSVD